MIEFKQFLRSINKHLEIENSEEKVSSKHSNIKVVFTGIRDKTLENLIQSNGGSVTGSVSKNTTHLVVKDVNENTAKIKKAKELNIKIMSLEDFKELLKWLIID